MVGMIPISTNRVRLLCGHTVSHTDHLWPSSDGQTLYDTRTCLDRAEGRKPQKFGRDE